MARPARGLSALSALVLFSILPFSLASPKKPASAARKEDIPFIRCQVCEKIAHQIYNQVEKKAAWIAPKKVTEFEIIEIAETVCNLKKQQADWILHIDIVEKGDELELVEQGTEGQCNSECKTIERACQEVMGNADTDVAEFFFKTKPSADLLVKFLCNDISTACSVKPPPIPKMFIKESLHTKRILGLFRNMRRIDQPDRIPGEPFLAKPSTDAEMEKILRSMEGMPGAPNMKMYSREDLMNMNNFGGVEADEDEEDDEEDFPTKLAKVLRNKDPPKEDLKHRILQGITETGKQVKRHVNMVSQTIRKWWQGKQKISKPPRTGKSEL